MRTEKEKLRCLLRGVLPQKNYKVTFGALRRIFKKHHIKRLGVLAFFVKPVINFLRKSAKHDGISRLVWTLRLCVSFFLSNPVSILFTARTTFIPYYHSAIVLLFYRIKKKYWDRKKILLTFQ